MKTRKIPLRRCVGCMDTKPKKELIRIVATAEGEVKIDLTGKVNGRGIYLCPNTNCFTTARKKNAIGRGLKVEITNQQLNQLFEELANYAGQDS